MELINNCPLMKIMVKQIKGDDYNNPILWQYQRLDDISQSLNIDINEHTQRIILALYLEKIYKPFDDYLINDHPEAFHIHRNCRYTSDMEYHALHEYLKINGFTEGNIYQFIEIDKNNRDYFQQYRKTAGNRYFDKYGNGQLKQNDYDSIKFKKYNYTYINEDICETELSQLSI
jgi:hypothetical protein